ncbi:hypothetical protein BVX93_01590 [bacterium B13(2017)]|nr:hypothetical protein BVX93_01590 [bacterium B13(2017)]
MKNDLTIDQFRLLEKKLHDLKRELEILLDVSRMNAKPVDLEEPIGRISRMDAMQDQSLAKSNKESLILKSKQVKASLNDISNNCYGICRLCKNPIGFNRLNAKPEAPFCIHCQNRIESKNKKSKRMI